MLRLWQLVDSGFPAGGFTHSGGLEAAMHHGDVHTPSDVERVTVATIRQAGVGALPLVIAAHGDEHLLGPLDTTADLFLNQPVSNRASRSQGRGLLSAATRIFPEANLSHFGERVERESLCGHHAPIFGVVMAALAVDTDTTARLFLYQSARGVISAAVRLGLIGVFDGQWLQSGVAGEIERTLVDCRDRPSVGIAQTAPILDLFQSTHDQLYSRLFQS